MERVYLDYNATAPLKPAVRAAMMAALDGVGNASSVHGFGREARRRVEEARARVAALVGARADDVVLTGGGTEANNLALHGSGRERRLVASIEHVSVLDAAPEAMRLPVTAEGVVDPAALDAALGCDPRPALVSLMLVNNETGVIQPVAEAARIAQRHGALVHCDAVQAVGRVSIELDRLGVDLLTLSAHKLGGPQGVGALIVAGGIALAPLLRGGAQERSRRAGTENVAGIVGFGHAALLAPEDLAAAPKLRALRDEAERRLRAAAPSLTVFGAQADRVANTSCVTMPGVPSETQLMALDLAGVAVSAGAACSSGRVRASHVLLAMGAERTAADEAIRISLGWRTTEGDIERLIEAWTTLHRRAGRSASAA